MTKKRRPRNRALPPLAAALGSALGPVPVTIVPDLTNPKTGKPAWGRYNQIERTILVRAGTSLANAHYTLEHERVHQVLCDAGIFLPDQKAEAIANAIAMNRVYCLVHGEADPRPAKTVSSVLARAARGRSHGRKPRPARSAAAAARRHRRG